MSPVCDARFAFRHQHRFQRWHKIWKQDYDKIYGDSVHAVGALNAHDPGGPYNYYNPWWHPFYRRGDLHSLQSVTKTITSVIIGVAIARHEFPGLSTPVLSFFDTASVKNIDERKRRMTVEHLLTMSAGFNWDETLHYNDPRNDCSQMEASFDWVQYVINTNPCSMSRARCLPITAAHHNYCPTCSEKRRVRILKNMLPANYLRHWVLPNISGKGPIQGWPIRKEDYIREHLTWPKFITFI